jgi:helix-turn-helix, Psq domain
MSRCTVCSNPLVSEVDLLLATGSSVRKVAQLYGIPRATLARHKAHIAPTSGKFAVISGPDGPK